MKFLVISLGLISQYGLAWAGSDYGAGYYYQLPNLQTSTFTATPPEEPGGGGGDESVEILQTSFTITGGDQLLNAWSENGLTFPNGGTALTVYDTNDAVGPNQAGTLFASVSTAPGTADFWVETVGQTGGTTANDRFGPAVISTASGAALPDGYILRLFGDGHWEASRYDDNTIVLISSATFSVTGTTLYAMKLEREGNALRGYIDGTLVTPTQLSDSTYTSGLRPGIAMRDANDAGDKSLITFMQARTIP